MAINRGERDGERSEEKKGRGWEKKEIDTCKERKREGETLRVWNGETVRQKDRGGERQTRIGIEGQRRRRIQRGRGTREG
jgi:hypothetical protein